MNEEYDLTGITEVVDEYIKSGIAHLYKVV